MIETPRATTYQEDKNFKELVKSQIYFADGADWVLEWVSDNFDPEDVFVPAALIAWAMDNGFVKEE